MCRVSLLPRLPFEFVVQGIAISFQTSSSSKDAWKAAVKAAASSAMPEGAWLLDGALAVTIFIFPCAVMQGDVDNRVKPILDALIKCVYFDDAQIERVVVQKFEPDRYFVFANPSEALSGALTSTDAVVYVKITDNLHEDLI